MHTVCVIPARGGSRRIPFKNTRYFHGKPIIAYAIQTALESHLFHNVIVSSDDPAILHVASQYKAEIMQRPEYLARNEVGTQQVMKYVLDHTSAELACCLYPCTPLVLPGDLIRAKQELLGNPHLHYVASIGYSADKGLHDAGAFYFGHASSFRGEIPLFDERTGIYQIPVHRDCDINTEADWLRAIDLYEFMVGQ